MAVDGERGFWRQGVRQGGEMCVVGWQENTPETDEGQTDRHTASSNVL